MLPAQHRLTRGEDFRRVSRRGRRGGGDLLVAHVLSDPAAAPDLPVRIGFVVGRSVGNSVQRHLVQRRLRHLVRDRLSDLPPGGQLVVRALAPAAHATYQELGIDLDRCLQRALAPSRPGPGTVS
ncbi:MAG: ribonuclease P protein component [Nocardioides sp.]